MGTGGSGTCLKSPAAEPGDALRHGDPPGPESACAIARHRFTARPRKELVLSALLSLPG